MCVEVRTAATAAGLGQMEGELTLSGRCVQFVSHHLHVRVVRQLEIVDAGHDGGQELVGILVAVHSFADDRQWRVQTLETCGEARGKCQCFLTRDISNI